MGRFGDGWVCLASPPTKAVFFIFIFFNCCGRSLTEAPSSGHHACPRWDWTRQITGQTALYKHVDFISRRQSFSLCPVMEKPCHTGHRAIFYLK